MKRTNTFLLKRLSVIWKRFFSDVKPCNDIYIKFGRRSKRQLGAIILKPGSKKLHNTIVTLTGYFKNPQVPEFVIDATIAHELVHYVQGFSSPRKKLHHYPHWGGIVNKELKNRGMDELLKLQKKWLKMHWRKIVHG